MTKTMIPTLLDETVAFRPVFTVFDELRNWAANPSRASCSNVSIFEDHKSLLIEAPVPGIKAEDIKVDLKEGVLYIQAEKREEKNEEKKEMKCHCKTSSRFAYSVLLPQPVDEAGDIKAQIKEGILTVTLPKVQEARPIKISVKNG